MLVIRPEEARDVAAVRTVHQAAFPTPMEARLVDRLRDNGNASVALVAEREGQVVGHILFSPVTINGDSTGRGIGLAPVAVAPEHERTGIASRLIRDGLEACRAAGYRFVVVLGATEFYTRFGFARASTRGLGNEYQADEHFMVLELQPGSLPPQGGLVRYGPEFAEFA